MFFQSQLYPARLIERITLVLADVCFDNGEISTAYCSNVSRMNGLADSGSRIYVSANRKVGRRLPFVWELAYANGTFVGVNMSHNYDLVLEGIRNGVIAELNGYAKSERLLPSSDTSLLDMRLTPADKSKPLCKVAIDTVYRKKGVDLLFPDGITVAHRHIVSQMRYALGRGERVVLLLLAQRIDAIGVRADTLADPEYVGELKGLYDKGLEILCYGCSVTPERILVAARLPFMF